MTDNTTTLGIIGTVSTFTLGQWNHAIGICAGLFTIAWVIYKFIKEYKAK